MTPLFGGRKDVWCNNARCVVHLWLEGNCWWLQRYRGGVPTKETITGPQTVTLDTVESWARHLRQHPEVVLHGDPWHDVLVVLDDF